MSDFRVGQKVRVIMVGEIIDTSYVNTNQIMTVAVPGMGDVLVAPSVCGVEVVRPPEPPGIGAVVQVKNVRLVSLDTTDKERWADSSGDCWRWDELTFPEVLHEGWIK